MSANSPDQSVNSAPNRHRKLVQVVIEVVLVCATYILLSLALMDVLHPSALMREVSTSDEFASAFPMIDGTMAQLVLVLLAALFIPAVRESIWASASLGNAQAWIIAITTAQIHILVGAIVFLEEPMRVFELSLLNGWFSSVPAIDGWSQEVVFRGYVIIRLSQAASPDWLKILLSAALFSSIHLGYVGSGLAGIFWPLFGTAMMGGFLAWAVLIGGGALLPVVIDHALIIAVLQPWLALS